MDYIPPLNGLQTDSNRPYIDADPVNGIMGSIPSGRAIEQPMREIVNAIKAAGIEPEKDNVNQLAQAIRGYVTQGFPAGGVAGQYLQKTEEGMQWAMPEISFLETLRYEMIGSIISVNSTSSNTSFVIADGREVLFSNYPELQQKIEANKLLCSEFDADGSTRAGMLGCFMYNASKTGAFLPDLGGYFIRYTHTSQSIDTERAVGSTQNDAIRNIKNSSYKSAIDVKKQYGNNTFGMVVTDTPESLYDDSPFYMDKSISHGTVVASGEAWASNSLGFDASRVVPTASDNRPYNIAFTPLIYLGKTQQNQ